MIIVFFISFLTVFFFYVNLMNVYEDEEEE